jgi:hypothetical protein
VNSLCRGIHTFQPTRIGRDRNRNEPGRSPSRRDVEQHQEARQGPARRKRRPNRWNRKSPGCQLEGDNENAAIEGCSVQKDAKVHPAEEDDAVRKTQTSSSLQNEPHSLHRAKAPALFPGLDTERGQTGPEPPLNTGKKERSV